MKGFMNNNMPLEKQKHSFKDTWGKLITYCKPFYVVIAIAFLCAIVGTIFTIIGPDKLSQITDIITNGILKGINLKELNSIAFLLVFMYSASFLLTYIKGFIMSGVTQKISKNLRNEISVKINKLPLKYFDSTTYGDILSRVTNDVDTIAQTLNQSIANLVASIALFIGSLIMMFITNWIMATVAILSSLFGFVFMGIIISHSQKYFRQQQEQLGAINGHIEEVYAGHNVVKAYNAEEKLNKSFESINNKLFNSAWKSQFMSGLMMPLMGFIGNFGYVCVCVMGAYLVLKGDITFGVIVAFMMYIRLFTQPLSQIAQALTSLQSTAAASKRVFEFLEEKEMSDETAKTNHLNLENVKGNVEFKNVRFGYNPDKTIINDFSVKINSGEKVAIVGPTGAGKTTLVNLLMRFYEISDGEIYIDNQPISSLTRKNIHSLFSMVLQDTWLFEGTIKENIVYGAKNVSDEEIVKVCKTVGLHHFIKTLPKGYNTILNENANMSAGQKQLITIARAMIENAPMIILDEATSSVDTRTEQLIQNAMEKLTVGRTSFVIAHRLSTIKNSDKILVMKDGDIIEMGNHDELIKLNGFYADLYNSQFESA
ncbi:MAG: ABC transporter ATP-binding protein [Oscillospiraceae bacterium]